MDTFFPTSTPDVLEELRAQNEILNAERSGFETEITNLTAQVDRMIADRTHWQNKHTELVVKIENVRGYIMDDLSVNGEMDENLKEIADLLDITLTKTISGTATLEISWRAEVPLDFDGDDFELSFDVDCQSYEADNFEWDTVDESVVCEDEEYS